MLLSLALFYKFCVYGKTIIIVTLLILLAHFEIELFRILVSDFVPVDLPLSTSQTYNISCLGLLMFLSVRVRILALCINIGYKISRSSLFNVVLGRRPSLWSSGQEFLVRFPALPDFLRSSGPGTRSAQPRDDN
jgi:hypothetical protein